MERAGDYNEAVRGYFSRPDHAGDLPGEFDTVIRAAVDEAGGAASLDLEAAIDGRKIAALAYRVHGCPFLIAALESFCVRFEGLAAANLEIPEFADIKRELAVPVEKSGRILLLEDAVKLLWSQYTGIKD